MPAPPLAQSARVAPGGGGVSSGGGGGGVLEEEEEERGERGILCDEGP